MRSSYSVLMQSKYYSPAFNSAIFDGPLRVYFAQMHESLALKIYFLVQQKFPTEFERAKEFSKNHHGNALVMVYPSKENLESSVTMDGDSSWGAEPWERDLIIGVCADLPESSLDAFLEYVRVRLDQWVQTDVSQDRMELL